MYYIVKKFHGNNEVEQYYTGANNTNLLYSKDKSDAELFGSIDECYLRYKLMSVKLAEEHTTEYYLMINSTEE